MSNDVKSVRKSGFRLVNVGGRSKKKTIAVVIILVVIAIAGTLFFVIGNHNVKVGAYEHLRESGVEVSEISDVLIKNHWLSRWFCICGCNPLILAAIAMANTV